MRMMAHRSRSQVLPEVDGDATLYSARIATNRTSTTRRSLCRSQFGEIQQEPSAVVDADGKKRSLIGVERPSSTHSSE